MRIALSLDPDVAERLQQETQRRGISMTRLVNDALRLGLGTAAKQAEIPSFEVHAEPMGVMPGVDPDRMNQLDFPDWNGPTR